MRKPDVLAPQAVVFLVLLSLGLGGFYRLLDLEQRPLHTDEAILATKFGEFWETGHFEYDPKDYHGPALHHVSWLYGKVAGWGGPETWTVSGLRHVPVLLGLLTMLSVLLMREALTLRGALTAMLLTSVSPMMVYYSRYYIMEMLLALLVALALGGWWRWIMTGQRRWLILIGLSIGLQHATKETFVLNIAAACGGWLVASLLAGGSSFHSSSHGLRLSSTRKKKRRLPAVAVISLIAIATSVTCYSALFRDWEAVRESVTTYGNYLTRSEGSGHEKPWHFYLTLIFWRKDGLVWTEGLIGGLGIVGILHAFLGDHRDVKRQRFLIFLATYTVLLFGVYSFLAYKTPWSILCAQHSLTLLAGVGAAAIWTSFRKGFLRLLFKVVLGLGVYHLCSQSMLAIDNYKADPRNPYVYSHTATHLLTLIGTVKDLEALAEEDDPLRVQVISRDEGWPLPWYFRNIDTIGYQSRVPRRLDADVVIADAERLPEIERASFGRPAFKDTGYHGLRPGVTLIMLVEQQRWNELMQARSQETESGDE